MKKDNLDHLFERLQGAFDVEEPENGHQGRFLEKLNQQQGSIAASVVIVAVLGYGAFGSGPSLKQQVTKIAPEVSQTEFYFASLIEAQVEELKEEKTPETAQLVDDTLAQLAKLDKDYRTLEQDLVDGGDSKIILSAMITNFQTRIDLLREVLSQRENIKNLKSQHDESFTI